MNAWFLSMLKDILRKSKYIYESIYIQYTGSSTNGDYFYRNKVLINKYKNFSLKVEP